MSEPDRDPRHDEAWRRRMAALAAEETVDPASEARAVDGLREAGYLRSHSRLSRVNRVALQTAAGIALLLAGLWWGRHSGPARAPTAPRFALFLLEDSTFQGTRTVGHDSLVAEYSAWAGNLAERGQLVLGEELGAAAWPLGPSLPVQNLAGQITGLFILSAASEGDAIAIARSCPHLRYGGGIVVRPIQPTS